MKKNMMIEMNTEIYIKLVPHLLWNLELFFAFSTVRGLPLSMPYTSEIIDANNGINKVSSDIKKAVAPYLGICPDCIP